MDRPGGRLSLSSNRQVCHSQLVVTCTGVILVLVGLFSPRVIGGTIVALLLRRRRPAAVAAPAVVPREETP
jgi:hypothetical protein